MRRGENSVISNPMIACQPIARSRKRREWHALSNLAHGDSGQMIE